MTGTLNPDVESGLPAAHNGSSIRSRFFSKIGRICAWTLRTLKNLYGFLIWILCILYYTIMGHLGLTPLFLTPDPMFGFDAIRTFVTFKYEKNGGENKAFIIVN